MTALALSRRNALAGIGGSLLPRHGWAASRAVPFSLGFAPHQGSFPSAGASVGAQIARAADLGFTAFEDNLARTRAPAEQEAIARLLDEKRMRMGVFVASLPRWHEFRPVLGADDGADRNAFLADIASSVAVARRTGARWMTGVPGFLDPRVPFAIQTARITDTLRRAADILEPHGIVLVLEPLNTLVDHPNVFLQTVPQAYALCRAVRSPSVKILADLYHAQIQAGNLIPTLDACWEEISYLQFGDTPGRNEPGTGEIAYGHIVRWLRTRSFTGIIGMEHGNSVPGPAGERRLVASYREIDAV